MAQSLITYQYYVQSNKRNDGTNTDMIIKFQPPLVKLSRDSVFMIQIYSLEIPFSFDQLDSTINTVNISVRNPANQLKEGILVLPTGTYFITDLLNQFKKLIITFCETSVAGYVGFTPVLHLIYNTSTGFSTYSTNLGQIEVDFIVNPFLGEMFGFKDVKLLITPLISQTSNVLCLTSPISHLLFRASNLKQFKSAEYIVEPNVYSDILCKINLSNGNGAWNYVMPNTPPVMIMNDTIDHINFYLTNNRSYNPIFLKGANYSFNFSISEVLLPKVNPLALNPRMTDISQKQPEKPEQQSVNPVFVGASTGGMTAMGWQFSEEQKLKNIQSEEEKKDLPNKLLKHFEPIPPGELYMKDKNATAERLAIEKTENAKSPANNPQVQSLLQKLEPIKDDFIIELPDRFSKESRLTDLIKEKDKHLSDLYRYKKKLLNVNNRNSTEQIDKNP